MIAPPAGVKIWLVAGVTDMRRGFDGLASLVAQQLNQDPFGGQLFIFRGRRGQHATFYIQFAVCEDRYRWHPLFGRTLQVSPFRRGKDLKCIYTDERPDLCRELPNWMFDEVYCSGMTLGLPEVSLVALHNLGRLLESLKRTRMRAARFSSRKLKEKRGAAKKNFGLGATSVRSEYPAERATSDQGDAGADRCSGRSASSGYRRATSRETDRERGRR